MARPRLRPCLLLLSVLVAGCDDDPVTPPPGGELFSRYVALGNSITAGFESDGINDSTQMHAYPVLLSERVGAGLGVALLRKPGCPPPLVAPAPLSNDRVGGADPTSCNGLGTPIASLIQSLAFPGFRIADALSIPSGAAGLLYRQAIGSRTLVEAISDADPTLVSVWLGNNDALPAMTTGDPSLLTPLSEFEASLATIVSAIAAEATVQDAVLIGVTNPLYAPLLQPGAYFWLVSEGAGAELLTKPVSDDCAPRTGAGAENPLASNLVSFRAFADPAVAEISCADDAPYVLNPDEQAEITARVAAFNLAIQGTAQANGWIYLDSNDVAEALLTDPDLIRDCQDLDPGAPLDEMLQAIDTSCPHRGAAHFFGSAVSLDGVHPSLQGQEIFTDVLHAALVARHGADLR